MAVDTKRAARGEPARPEFGARSPLALGAQTAAAATDPSGSPADQLLALVASFSVLPDGSWRIVLPAPVLNTQFSTPWLQFFLKRNARPMNVRFYLAQTDFELDGYFPVIQVLVVVQNQCQSLVIRQL